MKSTQLSLIGLGILAAAAMTSSAHAGGFSLSISIGTPRYQPAVIYRPPVVVAPPPVRHYRPPVVYVPAAPVYCAPPPVVYRPFVGPAPRIVAGYPHRGHGHRGHGFGGPRGHR